MGKILVTPKINPDLDGTACAVAYADLLNTQGRNVEGIIFGNPQPEAQYFINNHRISIPTQAAESNGNWDEFILVDASSMKGMPSVVDSNKVIEIVDHREGEPEKEFANAKIQNDLIGAAATIIVERFKELNLKITQEHAKLLYGAIYHNTLNFIASNTNERDREAVKFLQQEYDLDKNIIKEMFDYATEEITKNLDKALEDDSKVFGDKTPIGFFQLVVWGSRIFDQKQVIENVVSELAKKFSVSWSLLNVVDIEAKKSSIYSPDEVGQGLLSKAFTCSFEKGWTQLDKAWLRKQIMPKINELL